MKNIALLILLTLAFSLPLLAQDNSGSMQNGCCSGMSDHESMGNMHGSMNHGDLLPLDKDDKAIDLEKLDKNKDGKLFVCEMHNQVIKDASGQCPKCNMTLKETSIKDLKKSLTKNGFKVK